LEPGHQPKCGPGCDNEKITVFARQNGLVSGAPFIVMWFTMLLAGTVADLLQKKDVFTTTNVRKLANAVGT